MVLNSYLMLGTALWVGPVSFPFWTWRKALGQWNRSAIIITVFGSWSRAVSPLIRPQSNASSLPKQHGYLCSHSTCTNYFVNDRKCIPSLFWIFNTKQNHKKVVLYLIILQSVPCLLWTLSSFSGQFAFLTDDNSHGMQIYSSRNTTGPDLFSLISEDTWASFCCVTSFCITSAQRSLPGRYHSPDALLQVQIQGFLKRLLF